MRRILASLFVFGLTALTGLAQAAKKPDPSLAPIIDTPGLPRVLIIGDSISMGYTLRVRELLNGVANVHRIPENGGSTRDALEKIDRWLGRGKWDVILFNWGLHDLKHWKDNKLDLAGPQVTTVELYEANLRELMVKLKPTGAALLFATTTPVPPGAAGRKAGDEVPYNRAAWSVMEEAKVKVIDLHAFAEKRLVEWQLPKNVHFNRAGYDALAEQVAAAIKAALPAK
jgi:lysophospholipase L1-like esterase